MMLFGLNGVVVKASDTHAFIISRLIDNRRKSMVAGVGRHEAPQPQPQISPGL